MLFFRWLRGLDHFHRAICSFPTSNIQHFILIIIKIIDGFKIIDLPSVLTSGGPGISSESMTLHSFFTWRSLDLGGSAAISYMLFIIVVYFSLTLISISKRFTKFY